MKTRSSKRNVLTLALAGVFALLLGVIGWMEFGSQPDAMVSTADINRIVITRSGHPAIVLVRDKAQWRMTQPQSLPANSQRIDPLLSLVSMGTFMFAEYDITEVDMDAAGLNTPGATITIGKHEFQLGLPDIQGERRYALVDDKVSFVPEWVWSLIHGGVNAFADITE